MQTSSLPIHPSFKSVKMTCLLKGMFTLHYVDYHCLQCFAFSASTLLVGWQEGYPACKKTEWWGAGMVISLERVADLHMTQLMLLPLTVSSFSKIQIGFTFLVLAHLGSPGKRAVKRVCVFVETRVCVCARCYGQAGHVKTSICCCVLLCSSRRKLSSFRTTSASQKYSRWSVCLLSCYTTSFLFEAKRLTNTACLCAANNISPALCWSTTSSHWPRLSTFNSAHLFFPSLPFLLFSPYHCHFLPFPFQSPPCCFFSFHCVFVVPFFSPPFLLIFFLFFPVL